MKWQCDYNFILCYVLYSYIIYSSRYVVFLKNNEIQIIIAKVSIIDAKNNYGSSH